MFSSDVSVIFNAEKWQSLPADVQSSLNTAAIAYEKDSYQRFLDFTSKLDSELQNLGMEVIQLQGDAEKRYRKLANDVIWSRLKQHSPEYYDKLRSKFYRETID